MATAMNSGASDGRAPSVLGRSSFRLVVISGAVIMKITSSTSITSISGVMLMSLIGREPALRSRRPNAIAQDSTALRVEHHLAQVVREAFELGLAGTDPLAEDVVGQHRRDGHGQAGGGHDQRLADRAGDLLDGDAAGQRDAGQRVVDAPDRAEQADEGRGGADRRQQHLAELQVRQAAVQRVAQPPRQLRIEPARGLQRAAAGAHAWPRPAAAAAALRGRAGRAGRARRPACRHPRRPAPRAPGRGARACSTQPFQKISTQALIDISSSSAATARPTASAWPQKSPNSCIQHSPSTSFMPYRPGARPARKRAARRLPCA